MVIEQFTFLFSIPTALRSATSAIIYCHLMLLVFSLLLFFFPLLIAESMGISLSFSSLLLLHCLLFQLSLSPCASSSSLSAAFFLPPPSSFCIPSSSPSSFSLRHRYHYVLVYHVSVHHRYPISDWYRSNLWNNVPYSELMCFNSSITVNLVLKTLQNSILYLLEVILFILGCFTHLK